jgi:hypothetical protein
MAKQAAAAKAAAENLPSTIEETNKQVAVYDYGADAGAGFEGQSGEDYALPFLGLLQPNSPELENIEGAKQGQLINSVSQELFEGDVGVPFIPCTTEHCYVEWRPREKGGGIVKNHALDSKEVAEARAKVRVGKYVNAEGNELVETFYVYGVAILPDGPMAMAIAFTSTKIKVYKAWMTRAKSVMVQTPNGKVNPPLFAHIYHVRSTKEENTKGKFWNYDIKTNRPTLEESRLAPNDDLYVMARDLRDAVVGGMTRLRTDTLKGSAETEGAPSGGGNASGGKAPF